ncbi:hypothetical protein BC629DRAFT_1531991 [Irpex lacteus]|nr:hypothetical protein BC629DRAFT_1531991 [Irpex lacteus]
MGTRGLLGFIIRNRRRGTFNKNDSYPEELGAAIAGFIISLTEEQRLVMVERLEQIEWIEDASAEAPPDIAQKYRDEEFDCTWEETPEQRAGRPVVTQWGQLLYGMQGGRMLQPILDGRLRHLIDNTDFINDEAFCEWGYWVDFERKRLVMAFGLGVWTFAQVKKKGGFWDVLAGNRRRRYEDGEDESGQPDAWKCEGAPSKDPRDEWYGNLH